MTSFKPGQLVVLAPELVPEKGWIQLLNCPTRHYAYIGEKPRMLGRMAIKDITVVIFQENTTSGDVYVFGPDGGGWIQSAYLRVFSG